MFEDAGGRDWSVLKLKVHSGRSHIYYRACICIALSPNLSHFVYISGRFDMHTQSSDAVRSSLHLTFWRIRRPEYYFASFLDWRAGKASCKVPLALPSMCHA